MIIRAKHCNTGLAHQTKDIKYTLDTKDKLNTYDKFCSIKT